MKYETKFKFSDYAGKQISYLTAVAESETLAKDSSKQWDFQCVCGKIVTCPPYRVISGHIKSCGCMRYKNITRTIRNRPKQKVYADRFVGKKNNRLTVIGYERPVGSGRVKLKCQCDCGNIVYVLPYQFENGAVKSCGCLRGEKRRTHGLSGTPIYFEWFQMVNRCHNPKAPNYDRYGGRGIYVCEEWRQSPEAFVAWVESIGGRPDGMTLDRIDNDGPYSPDNCRWASSAVQSRNKRSARMVTYKGKTQCLADWSKELGVARHILAERLNRGWSVDRAFTEPIQHHKKSEAAL